MQLRDKTSSLQEIKTIALTLENLCNKYNAIFVLNDKVELAIELGLGLSGLHIGRSDHYRVEEIRKKISGCLGVSCYGDVTFAKEMEAKGIDYVAFGSFFTSPTKPNSNIIDLEVLSQAKEKLSIPVCTIGGLNTHNIDDVMIHKQDMISLINEIWTSEDIKSKAKYFVSICEEERWK
ncbi:MAG: thiamine-phosphate pyrophosphorylase [Sulfurimonas sp.]|uniref:thiamine phosphate synthase n=1 Tax=Sulfurimonas sp. TaxID=2022749 RepID=UPI0039E6F31E